MRNARHPLAVVALAVALLGTTLAWADGFPTVRYRLQPGSTYQEGCFEPCYCPILVETPLLGTFDLVYWPFAGPLDRWGIENVDWAVPLLDKQVTGAGFYTRAGELDALELDLQFDEGPIEHFDSGDLAPAAAGFPDLDITVSIYDMYCWDVVLHVVASPEENDYPTLAVAPAELSWTAVPGASTYDVACGDLLHLRESAGDFTGSADPCMADDHPATSLPYDLTPTTSEALWFLVRPSDGTYGHGDTEPNTCP